MFSQKIVDMVLSRCSTVLQPAPSTKLNRLAIPPIGAVGLLLMTLCLFPLSSAQACGGFFCQNAPVDQAGEQIVFRQEGSTITAMVRILYSGDAEDFSWVVPVPNAPELSVGSDTTFNELDFQTRPQFILDRRGQECSFATDDVAQTAATESAADSDGGANGSLQIEELSVGPYDVQIISSDDPDELATWLQTNDYDLTDRGAELIKPYVDAGMKFVALKLRSGESSGSIQPLIMQYQSEKPMVPIRLTAVAAQDDMGVLVWVVGETRAVPENYLHVIPNYTRLNWYTGPFNAYASYQGLITTAMDEAGGQGFATDFAGSIGGSISAALSRAETIEQNLIQLDGISNDAEYLTSILVSDPTRGASVGQVPSQGVMFPFFQTALPLPAGFDTNTYFDQFALTGAFSASQLAQARIDARQHFLANVVTPLENSTRLLPDGAYMTRLYTTLSAEEMTLDPVFTYNATMPNQDINRNAVLEASCTENGTRWTLTLGSGTGRAGEVVIDAGSDIPFSAPVEVTTQASVFQTQETSATADPVVIRQNTFQPLLIGIKESSAEGAGDSDDDSGVFGLGKVDGLFLSLLGLIAVMRRYRFT